MGKLGRNMMSQLQPRRDNSFYSRPRGDIVKSLSFLECWPAAFSRVQSQRQHPIRLMCSAAGSRGRPGRSPSKSVSTGDCRVSRPVALKYFPCHRYHETNCIGKCGWTPGPCWSWVSTHQPPSHNRTIFKLGKSDPRSRSLWATDSLQATSYLGRYSERLRVEKARETGCGSEGRQVGQGGREPGARKNVLTPEG